jgi:hypothetical protein
MININPQITQHIKHHIDQGGLWLEQSELGNNNTYLAYAALELRFAIERLVLLYRAGLEAEGKPIEIMSFKRIEKLIYKIAGNSLQIKRRFEFMDIFCEMLQIQLPQGKPNLPLLSKHWDTCSEMCHAGWAMTCVSSEIGSESYKMLVEVKSALEILNTGIKSWPEIIEPNTKELEQRFINGKVSVQDVRKYFSALGLEAVYVSKPGAEPVSIGVPVPKTIEL